jgi:hypothetical protein
VQNLKEGHHPAAPRARPAPPPPAPTPVAAPLPPLPHAPSHKSKARGQPEYGVAGRRDRISSECLACSGTNTGILSRVSYGNIKGCHKHSGLQVLWDEAWSSMQSATTGAICMCMLDRALGQLTRWCACGIQQVAHNIL